MLFFLLLRKYHIYFQTSFCLYWFPVIHNHEDVMIFKVPGWKPRVLELSLYHSSKSSVKHHYVYPKPNSLTHKLIITPPMEILIMKIMKCLFSFAILFGRTHSKLEEVLGGLQKTKQKKCDYLLFHFFDSSAVCHEALFRFPERPLQRQNKNRSLRSMIISDVTPSA